MGERPAERRICMRRIFRSGGSAYGDTCQLPPIVEVEGEWYCRVHNPDARAKRAKELNDKWKAEQQRHKHADAIDEAERRVIEAAKEWAAGANSAHPTLNASRKLMEAVRALQGAEHA